MKVHELLGSKQLRMELLLESVTLGTVGKLSELKNLKNKYYTDEINVIGDVNLGNKKLTVLPVKFGEVGGSFLCYNNALTSLEGSPRKVSKTFDCSYNKLTSLEGAPQEIGRFFSCSHNLITSLEGIHKIIKKAEAISFYDNPIKSGGIGLLLVDGLERIGSNLPAFKIISKYLGQGKRGLLLCQEELIEAGYEEYAKL